MIEDGAVMYGHDDSVGDLDQRMWAVESQLGIRYRAGKDGEVIREVGMEGVGRGRSRCEVRVECESERAGWGRWEKEGSWW